MSNDIGRVATLTMIVNLYIQSRYLIAVYDLGIPSKHVYNRTDSDRMVRIKRIWSREDTVMNKALCTMQNHVKKLVKQQIFI